MFGLATPKIVEPEAFHLASNGRIPNSHLAVVLYRGVSNEDDLEIYFRRYISGMFTKKPPNVTFVGS